MASTTLPSSTTTSTSPSTTVGKQRSIPNGAINRPKSQNDSKNQSQFPRETNTADKHARDRLLFLLATFMGCTATVTVKSGNRFSGVFSGASLETTELAYVLKMVKQLQSEQTNGFSESHDGYVGYGDDHAMTFEIKDVVDMAVTNVFTEKLHSKLGNGTSNFLTDADISGNLALRERELQRWEPTSDSTVDLSLNGARGTWDQFETNERLYGLKTNYDENIYTTSIDRSHPSYKERAAAADRLVREIEGSTTTNLHVAEERGFIRDDSGIDEEERFSGVRRDFPPLASSQTNRYTPPARRAPTGHITVPGAPVDPAIISSQLARPETSTARPPKSQNGGSTLPPKSSGKGRDSSTANVLFAVVKGDMGFQTTGTEAAVQQMDPQAAVDTSGEVLSPLSKVASGGVATAPVHQQSGTPNATANVEYEVRDAFKSFAASEKLKVQERQRLSARREKEMKLNDLKKFSTNFKLKSPLPMEIIGILAKDKHKQTELVEKARRQIEEQNTTSKAPAVLPEQVATGSSANFRVESVLGSPHIVVERQNQRTSRANQGPFNGNGARLDRSLQASHLPAAAPRNTGTGQLGQRLLAQQSQLRERGVPNLTQPMPIHNFRVVPTGPTAINTNVNMSRAGSIQSPTSALAARLNVQALEFKPNPAATSFSPPRRSSGIEPVSTSPPKALSASRSSISTSFFADKKPRPVSDRKSIRDGFNPITRMKKEVEAEKTSKEAVVNGGIPPAYKTPPTWDCPKENKDKTYKDMFEQTRSPAPPTSPANSQMPHQHQLPLHLQPGSHAMPPVHTPQQAPRHGNANARHPQAREHHFDDHRMHLSSSNSSVFPSPRYQQPMLAYPSPMVGPIQPVFGQPFGQYAIGPHGQPYAQLRQFPGAGNQFGGPQGGHVTAPMMLNQSGAAPFMTVPMQPQMQMFSPGQSQVFPAHIGGAQTPGPPNGYGSPRAAPIMVHQGSQQGQQPQSFFYVAPGQHPQMLAQQQAVPMHIRGGMPMHPQQSFQGSPHLQYHVPAQHRGVPYGGNFGHQQQMHPHHAMPLPSQLPGPSMNHNIDHEEQK